jgi:hypothetical protein
METINEILKGGRLLTAAMLNRLQAEPSSGVATEWKRSRGIFSVSFGGRDYFPHYQFDASHQPLPIIGKVLEKFAPAADTWKIAAWFYYPNGWIVDSGPEGVRAVAPKDALDRPDEVLNALERRTGSYYA